jgi:hypothetical protein
VTAIGPEGDVSMHTHVLTDRLVSPAAKVKTRTRYLDVTIGRILVVLTAVGILVAGALLTLSMLETTEYDRDAYSLPSLPALR